MNDPWIDDGEMGEEREDIAPIYSDFKCIASSLEDFYKSPEFNLV